MAYEYKMVQVPPTIQVRERDLKGSEAASYLASVVTKEAVQGFEFYRVDEIGVQVQPGCLAALFGARAVNIVYYVVSFRREKP
jgi:hypothetical protein